MMNPMNDTFKDAYITMLNNDVSTDTPVVAATVEAELPVDTETEKIQSNLKKITFYTDDAILIDALNSGFEEAVFFVNGKDEVTGEDTVVEVKFGKESFQDYSIEDAEEDAEEECPECKDDECANCMEEADDIVDTDISDSDVSDSDSDIAAESVSLSAFRKHVKHLAKRLK